MNTTTGFELTRTPVSSALSEIIFGGASNSYYADPRTRLVFGYVLSNAHGEHVAHMAIARSIDYAENELSELLISQHLCSSPVFTVIDDCHEWIAKMERFVVENITSGEFDAAWRDCPIVRERHTFCKGCGHFDTLSTSQQAWCDVTTCSTESCDFENVYMIGD